MRQAIAHALDRQAILEKVYFGNGEEWPLARSLGPYAGPTALRCHAMSEICRQGESESWTEGGFPVAHPVYGFPPTIMYDTSFAKLAEVLRDQVASVGIDLQLRLMDRNAWIDAVYKHWDFDLAFTHFENGADPDIGVKRVYVSSNIVPIPFSNAAGYHNPRIDELFDMAAKRAGPCGTGPPLLRDSRDSPARRIPVHLANRGGPSLGGSVPL